MKTAIKKIMALSIAIIICLCAASCAGKDEYVPAGFKRASDKNAEYALYVPEGWVVDISTGVTSAKVSDKDTSNISFMSFDLDDSIVNKETDENESETKKEILDIFWDYYSAEFVKTFPDMKYEAEGENILVSKLASKKYVYTATVTGIEFKFMQVVTIKNGAVYLLTYTAQKDVYEKHLSDVNEIIKYIEIK